MKTRNGKWAVNISKSNTAPIGRKSSEWKVMVQRYRPATDEKCPSLLKFVDATKRQIELKVQHSIDSVKRWQTDTYSKIDMIQQQLIRTYNSTNTSICDTENTTQKPQQQSEQPKIKTVIFPSMPLLIDDTSNENPSVIRPTVAKKIAKRRNTVNPNSPLKLSAPDLPLRKNSRLVHSSVLAISKNPIELENHFEDQTFTGTETHVIETNRSNSTVKKPQQHDETQSEVFQTFLELRKLFLENARRDQHKH